MLASEALDPFCRGGFQTCPNPSQAERIFFLPNLRVTLCLIFYLQNIKLDINLNVSVRGSKAHIVAFRIH